MYWWIAGSPIRPRIRISEASVNRGGVGGGRMVVHSKYIVFLDYIVAIQWTARQVKRQRRQPLRSRPHRHRRSRRAKPAERGRVSQLSSFSSATAKRSISSTEL